VSTLSTLIQRDLGIPSQKNMTEEEINCIQIEIKISNYLYLHMTLSYA
jgi:hypothetical protein